MSDTNTTTFSFWNLLEKYEIVIPKIQRDYAQGLTDVPKINSIREGLLKDIKTALTEENRHLSLNFVYGSVNDKQFIPLDGQQRLTTLYLLHWYVFSFAESFKKIDEYKNISGKLKNFTYQTRNTSGRFCKKLCSFQLDKNSDTLPSLQIKNENWYTGSFHSDPTVKSMLGMLDDIHCTFKDTEFDEIAKKLIGKECECPITFVWQKMENFTRSEDLYIKMNARGKQLTEFEIFKAKIQSFKLLNDVLEINPDNADDIESQKKRIDFISKFNNQYTDYFYSLKNDVTAPDRAMINLVRQIIRDDYFKFVDENVIYQNKIDNVYHNDFSNFCKLSGAMLAKFVEDHGIRELLDNTEKPYLESNAEDEKLENLIEKLFADSLSKLDKVLECFCKLKHSDITHPELRDDGYYSEKNILEDLCSDVEMPYKDSTKCYALFAYWHLIGFPENSENIREYNHWKRFVYNILNNISFESHPYECCRIMSFLRNILSEIMQLSNDGVVEKLTLNAIVTFFDRYEKQKACGTNVIRLAALIPQFEEETIKARLMLSSDDWYKIILDAEDYFCNGEIIFLLDLAKKNGDYNLNSFRNAFNLAKAMFNESKEIKDNKDNKLTILFEQTLLFTDIENTPEKDDRLSNDGMAHLPEESSSYYFPFGKYNSSLSNRIRASNPRKYSLFIRLFHRMLTNGCNADNIEEWLKNRVAEFGCSTPRFWKHAFISNGNLFRCFSGSEKKHIRIHEDTSAHISQTLLLTKMRVSSASTELNTCLLYLELNNAVSETDVHLELVRASGSAIIENGFPRRFIEYGELKIGFTDKYIIRKDDTNYSVKDDTTVNRLAKCIANGTWKELCE